MPKKKTTSEFIEESKIIHGNKYDYSLVKYINSQLKIKIICKKHGIFEQKPNAHIHQKQGCSKCSNNYNYTNTEFIQKCSKIHNNKYDYSLVNYKNNRTPVIIICKKHGEFKQKPTEHLNGFGCKKCSNNYNYTNTEFIQKCSKIHNNKYDYSLVKYFNSKSYVKIICPIHGIFTQISYSHLSGIGCPLCNESKGEKEIRYILENKKIEYIFQKSFKGCKYKNDLKFDFYLPKENICIEFDGIQHFKPFDFFGGEKEFKILQKKDKIKNEYCKNNNIRLIRIKFNENIVEKIKPFLF